MPVLPATVSLPPVEVMVSSPAPPLRLSLPPPPSVMTLLPLLPTRTLFPVLPLTVIGEASASVILPTPAPAFSTMPGTFAGALKVRLFAVTVTVSLPA